MRGIKATYIINGDGQLILQATQILAVTNKRG